MKGSGILVGLEPGGHVDVMAGWKLTLPEQGASEKRYKASL